MDSLDIYRKEIEDIDSKLVELFEKRMDIAVKVAEYKKSNKLPIYDEERESLLIRKNVNKLSNKEYEIVLRRFFLHVMELSRSVQNDIIQNQND